MRNFYLDTEFDGFGGGLLISLALIDDEGNHLYLINPDYDEAKDPWVRENVLPILYEVPHGRGWRECALSNWGPLISDFIYRDPHSHPNLICDWPSDVVYINNLLMTGPGFAVPMNKKTSFTIVRHINVYPSELTSAVQHNALWDVLAIRECLKPAERSSIKKSYAGEGKNFID